MVITNYPEGQVEELEAINNPEDPSAGTRKLPFSREIFIDQDDFREVPPPKYFRLTPGREVRLRYGYIIKCEDFVQMKPDAVRRNITAPTTPKPAAVMPRMGARCRAPSIGSRPHHALDAEVRMYDRLFTVENPAKVDEEKTFLDYLNPDSLKVIRMQG